MLYPNIKFMIRGWFLIIVINSLDTDQVLRNVPLDLDLNCLKRGEPCIYHKGWLIITFISSFVGPDLDLNYLNNSNLDQTHQRATLDLGLHCVCCARSHVWYIFYSVSRYLKDIVFAMKTKLYADRRRPISHCAITSQHTHFGLESITVWSGKTVVRLVKP